MSDHEQFLARQVAYNRMAFGPGERRKGVLDHIEQEIEEVRTAETHAERAAEWVDLVLLSQDGLLRSVREGLREQMAQHADKPTLVFDMKIIGRYGEPTADYVAKCALDMITAKRDKNECRDWDDWRIVGEDHAVNHVKGTQVDNDGPSTDAGIVDHE